MIHQNSQTHYVQRTNVLLTQIFNAYMEGPWAESSLGFHMPKKRQILAAPLYETQPEYEPVTPLCDESLVDSLTQNFSPASVADCKLPFDHQDILPRINLICDHAMKAKVPLKNLKSMIDLDEKDDLVDYRCQKCTDCEECKLSPSLKAISLKEAYEQTLIEKSVRIDYDQQKTFCKLPWTRDPVQFLQKKFGGADNLEQAHKVYISQTKKSPEIKDGIRKAFQDLLGREFLLPLDEMPDKVKELVENAPVRHYYPWRSVQKPGSLSTPTRIVVDPSQSGLNLILAKGSGGVAKMVPILMRSRCSRYTWTSDISKLYNQLWLDESDFPYSLVLYDEKLDPDVKPRVFLMLRAWYGVISTGGQALYALRLLGLDNQVKYPSGSSVLLTSSYVDDLLPGASTKSEAVLQVKETRDLLKLGGFETKFVCHSFEAPPEIASSDNETVGVLGYTWRPLEDTLSLGITDLNFHPKKRGMKEENPFPVIDKESAGKIVDQQDKITKRMCLAKSSEIYDPLGIMEPLKSKMKRDLSKLNGTDWDEPVPDTEYTTWRENFLLFPELRKITAPRSVVPENCSKPSVCRLIVASDASVDTAGACAYIGFQLNDGTWSNQLLISRSKLCKYSVPRNELTALFLATELCYAVCHSLQPLNLKVSDILFLTDSTVALSWCFSRDRHQKTFVHNRVSSIHRFLKWIVGLVGNKPTLNMMHIPGTLNPSDILTKGCPDLSELSHDSKWQGNWDYLKGSIEDMPLTSYEDLRLTKEDLDDYRIETMENIPIGIKIEEPILQLDLPHGDPLPEWGDVAGVCDCDTAADSSSVFFSLKKPGLNDNSNYVIDIVKYGWIKSVLYLEAAVEFGCKLIHRTHQNSKNRNVEKSLKDKCVVCKFAKELGQSDPVLDTTSKIVKYAREATVQMYFDTLATNECLKGLTKKELEFYETNDEGILFYKGRIGPEHTWSTKDLDHLNLEFLEDEDIKLNKPCLLSSSPMFYAYFMYVHHTVIPHAGLERTLKKILERFHVIKPRRILSSLLQSCIKCRLIQKTFLQQEMSNHNQVRFTLAPPFSAIMCDVASPFNVKTRFQGRQTMKCPALVVVCLLTGASAAYICESEETQSIVLALERHSYRFGVPSCIYVDAGTAMKKLNDVSFSLRDFQGTLKKNMRCEVIVSKPKNHCEQGRVEVRIRIFKKMILSLGEKDSLLSFIGWETLFCQVSNLMNDLPICRPDGSTGNIKEGELITPNRLLHGRNYHRSMTSPFYLEGSMTQMMDRVDKCQTDFYKLFIQLIPSLIAKPKWPTTTDLDVGDIVLFFLEESKMGKKYMDWHYGRVVTVQKNTVELQYVVGNGDASSVPQPRLLIRSRRDLVKIAKESELDFGSPKHYNRMSAEKQSQD